jgi:hypothetical protein
MLRSYSCSLFVDLLFMGFVVAVVTVADVAEFTQGVFAVDEFYFDGE